MRVLVVEDDPRGARLLAAVFEQLEYKVTTAPGGAIALSMLAEHEFDLATIDLGLPDVGGLDLIAHIREVDDLPIIVVTGRSDLSDVVTALATGADDYLVKPIRPSELGARATALLRRVQRAARPADVETYRDPRLLFDFRSNEIAAGERHSTLSDTERRVLKMLVNNAGRVLPHEELLARVWGPGWEGSIANLHVYVNQLRRKIEPDPANPRYIETHRGVGYRFVPAEDGRTT